MIVEIQDPPPPSCNCFAAKSLQSCLTLCNPIDGSPPGFPVPGIFQARVLEWVVITLAYLSLISKLENGKDSKAVTSVLQIFRTVLF